MEKTTPTNSDKTTQFREGLGDEALDKIAQVLISIARELCKKEGNIGNFSEKDI